jgi:hypothetical protein
MSFYGLIAFILFGIVCFMLGSFVEDFVGREYKKRGIK